jgi:hypothetical protein
MTSSHARMDTSGGGEAGLALLHELGDVDSACEPGLHLRLFRRGGFAVPCGRTSAATERLDVDAFRGRGVCWSRFCRRRRGRDRRRSLLSLSRCCCCCSFKVSGSMRSLLVIGVRAHCVLGVVGMMMRARAGRSEPGSGLALARLERHHLTSGVSLTGVLVQFQNRQERFRFRSEIAAGCVLIKVCHACATWCPQAEY